MGEDNFSSAPLNLHLTQCQLFSSGKKCFHLSMIFVRTKFKIYVPLFLSTMQRADEWNHVSKTN